ncbi:MAG: HAD-IIIA family hydrolase [Synergistaceae bacterium]|jgi:D-glycero-D-manno-heptose 1,7-bisphosphate phosphatase|nr:HAD-IIIA family hydrolase [Synergistaceae bacterium]
MTSHRRAIFLDRDGVITANVYYERWKEWEAPMSPGDVELLPNAAEALLRFQRKGYLLFIVSNQGAYAKGKIALESLVATAKHVEALLAGAGVEITESYYSYSHPQGVVSDFSGISLERKPSPYFPRLAAASHGVDLSNSWMVGDRDTDILCGRAAGCRTLRIFSPHAEAASVTPDLEAQTLFDAVEMLVNFVS